MTSPNGSVATAGAVALDVEPDAQGFYPRLRSQVLPAAEQVGRDIARQIAGPIVNDVATSITRGIRDAGRGAGQAEATRTGNAIGDNIGRAIKTRVQAAVATLPTINIDGDTSGLQRKLDVVRGQVMSLRDVDVRVTADTAAAEADLAFVTLQAEELAALSPTVTVDVNGAAAAVAELEAVETAALAIAGFDPTIDVDVDAGTALAELTAVADAVEILDGIEIDIRVDVDDAGALADMAVIAAAAVALGRASPTITPNVNPVPALAGLAAIFSAATIATVGVNAVGLAGGLIATILVPAAAAAAVALAAIGPAALLGVAGIGVLAFGLSGVVGAITKLNSAQDSAAAGGTKMASSAAAVASAQAGVESAERALANTRAQNADAMVRANERIEAAERTLAAAKRDTLAAEQALDEARKSARESAEDLALAVNAAALSERQAQLSLTRAKAELERVEGNPLSSDTDRQAAQLAFEQAKQNLAEIEVRQRRLGEQKRESDRAGIEGSEQVRAAQDRIADAQERQRQAAAGVAEAERAKETQQRQAAFALANATAAVANAQRGLAQAHQSAGAAGVSAANSTASALAGLSGPERDFVRFIMDVKDEFTGLRAAAAGGFLPGLEAGIRAFLPVLPQVRTFLGQVSTALGDLFRRGGEALASPFWVDFFELLGNMAGPVLRDFGTILGNVTKGFASLFVAFAPVSEQMMAGLADMATGFAEWAASLAESDGFQQFVDYVVTNGPALLGMIGDLVLLFIRLGVVLAPIGAIVLQVVASFLNWLTNLPPSVFTAIVIAVGALAVVLGILSGSVGAVVAGVALLVGGLVYAWQNFDTFRAIVTAVWQAVAAGAMWLWDVVLKPTFDFVVAAVVAVGAYFMRLWTNYISPAITLISAIISFWWTNVVSPIFNAIVFVLRNFVFPVIMALYRNIVVPAFLGIRVAISVAWAVIRVIFGVIQIAIKALGAVFMWLYTNAVKPVFEWIYSKAIKPLWENYIKPVLQALGDYIEKTVAPAFQRGVTAVSKAWSAIRSAASAPIRFVLETVLNNGILAAYNKIAGMFGVKPDDVQITIPKGFATGGFVSGPGGPTSDSIMARLSNGEYVIPAHIVSMFGVGFFDWLIGKSPFGGRAVRPGDGSEGLAFAKGGAVPGFAEGGFVGRLKGLWNGLKDPLGWVKGQAQALINTIPGARYLVDMASAIGEKLLGGAIKWLTGKITNVTGEGGYRGPVSAEVADVQRWVQAQHGKPYQWASAGPSGYDCSGAVGAVYNMLHGKSPHSRVFSTANMEPFFPKLNQWGVLTAGWAHPGERGASPGVGHTAGNIAGLGFESRGGDGFVVGNGASKVTSFARFGTYDTGGWLMPGLTVAYNGTGRPESIRTAEQEAALQRQLSGQGGPRIVNNIYPRYAVLDERQLAARNAAEDTRMRIGRPD